MSGSTSAQLATCLMAERRVLDRLARKARAAVEVLHGVNCTRSAGELESVLAEFDRNRRALDDAIVAAQLEQIAAHAAQLTEQEPSCIRRSEQPNLRH